MHGRLYGWWRGTHPEDKRWGLPEILWGRVAVLDGAKVYEESWGCWADFTSRQAALDALSEAILLHVGARSRASGKAAVSG